MRQKHTTMVLSFKIKLKKDCTRNASVVRLCSISEVVKPSSKMTLLYSKIAAMWHVQEKSPIHYFGSFLIQRNLKETQLYCLLLYSNTFRGHFKIGGALPQLQKTVKYFTDQIQDGRPPPSILKKAGFRYGTTKINLGQSEVPVQR